VLLFGTESPDKGGIIRQVGAGFKKGGKMTNEHEKKVDADMIEFKKEEVERLEMLETQVPRDLLYIGHNIVSHHETKVSEAFIKWCINELNMVAEKMREIEGLGHVRYEIQQHEAEEERARQQKDQEAKDEKAMQAARLLQKNGFDVDYLRLNGSVRIEKTHDGQLDFSSHDNDIPF
jgi:hypothetical protein